MKWALVGFAAGVAVGAWTLRARDSDCCERLSYGARDKIAGYTGPLSGLTSTVLDATGLTKLLPGLLDWAGVAKDGG